MRRTSPRKAAWGANPRKFMEEAGQIDIRAARLDHRGVKPGQVEQSAQHFLDNLKGRLDHAKDIARFRDDDMTLQHAKE